MAEVEEEVLAKTGAELFKELLRYYPVAEVEDYFKAGQWKNDMMKTDLQLLFTHRREAGAPDPIPLEEVKMPEMPQTPVAGAIQLPGTAGVRPLGAAVAPAAVRPVVVAKAGAVPTAAGSAVTELRLIALFIAKWKLDPTRVKVLLAKLLPARRRFVIQYFKCTNPGPEATNLLEQFIAKCEQTNWAAANAAGATAGLAAVAPRPVAPMGVKRPLMPTMAGAVPAKRPHIVAAVAGPKAVAPLRPVGAVRPAIRPVGLRPAMVAPKVGQAGGVIKGLLQSW